MAYECQFWDSMTSFKPNALWKAYSEPKYKFFSWLLLHDRVHFATVPVTLYVHFATVYLRQHLIC
jgi:hypothetical protein